MKKTLKLLALLMALVMVMALLPTAALAEEQSSDHIDTELPTPNGYIPVEIPGGRAVSEAYASGDMETYYRLKGVESTRDTLPSSYDSRNYNYITSVKNQNPYGSCWAHAAMACIESYMIKHGVEVGSTGSAATTDLNLSETQHCYFNYSTAYDAEGMLTGDKCTLLGSDSCLDAGGNGEMSAYTLQRWCGAADESAAADLQYSKAGTVASSGLNSQYSYNYNISHVQNSEWIPATDIEGVKRAIMSYGAGNISYYAGSGNYTYNCTIDTSSQSSSSHKWANHAITVVGWDDSIAADRFSPNKPSGDGAWLCKNSWGTSYFNQGYMYISYEDTSVLEGYIFFYDAEPIDNYDHNYQYDGSCNVVTYGVGNRVGFANNTKVANVFTANGSELLEAVALCNWDEALDYTVEIYKNPTTGNPSSGTLMSTQSGTLTYSGYYTIVLDTPVLLSTGDTFSVVFTQSVPEADDEGKYVHTPYDANFKDTSLVDWASWTHTNHGNTSYYQEPNGAWTDCPDNGDYRIKAYTVDYENPYTVTAVSNNDSYGTVSVTGTVITATPADGYYVESAEVISGTAAVTVNGNTVNVSPESDCEIRVNFAPKPSYTVNFVAVGNAEGSETALLNDAITLPSSVSANVDGWEFSGWVDAELAETTDEPAFYAPGASYTVTANATLYALYTRLEEGFGAPVYELVTAAPSDWSGNYVVTNGETSSMYVMKGVTLDGDSENIESSDNASAFANSGITLSDAVLSDVATDYVFTLAAQDSYYSIQSVSTGVYLGMNSSYLYGFTYYDSSCCNWTPGINSSHAVRMENAAGGSFPYLSFTSNGYFWAYSASNADVLRLWKETNGDAVYYTTTPHEPYTITAVSNNDAWGTVSVSGNTITATPATGCYLSGYEVTSGTATVTINDNTIRVKPDSDCTITVIFAQKPSYTVSFVAVGYNEGSETAYEGDEITLPSSVSTFADGWEFSGWIDAELAETTNKPVFYAPGASYTVTADATLYALYTRSEGEGGEPVYELVTEAPSDWSGNYVITNGETSSMYVLKGVTGSSAGTNAETSGNCTAYANSGITLADNVLSDVADDYVMTFEAQGSYYSVKSASIGSYYGMNSSSYLYAYSGYNATYCNWTPAINSSGVVQLKNAANGSYPYFSFSTSNSYFWSGSSNNANVLRLWKETGGSTVYYTTSPVAPHQHTYGDWTSNNDGTHSHTCSGCGDIVTENCTYNDVVTDPTTTEQGYTTHTCTVCGYSYVDSYVDPLLYTVTAVSNNDAWGTVSVGGYTIIATPATGYYLSDCEVTTGTATTTVSGNTITVTPESDCTVMVNFAPIPTYTVTYISTGAPAGSATGYIGDVINLPTSVSNEPEDWTFIGWMETKLDETTEEPAYYEPGEDYTVTGDVTLYALFTRVEEGTGDVAYQLTEDLAVGGRYVITNLNDEVGEYAVGNTIVNTSNNHYVNALSVTADSDTLTVPSGVDVDTILYEIESGDTSSGWVFSNVANNKYLGLTDDEYLTMSDSPLAWRYDYDDVQGYYYLDNQVDSEGYYYLSYDTNNDRFTTNKSAKDIRMYQEINAAVNFYTTDPVVPAEEPAFMTQSLLLEGDIGVRFYIYLPEALRNASTNVSFTISGKGGEDYASTVAFSEELPTNSSGYYGFTFYVNTIQMADTITATLNYGDGAQLEKTYSVKEYFEAFDEAYGQHPELYTDDIVNLIKATADLGHYMQMYLETRGSWSFENGDHVAMDPFYTIYTQEDLDEAKTAVADHALTLAPSGDVSKFKKVNYTVNLESHMSIRVIVQMKTTFSGELTAAASYTDDEGTHEVICNVTEQTGTRYMIEIPNVQAHQLSRMYEIVISSDEGALTLTGSALSYVNMMLAGAEDYISSVVQDAAIAFYRYSKYADIVKGNPSDISKANGSNN